MFNTSDKYDELHVIYFVVILMNNLGYLSMGIVLFWSWAK
jgi:hypothetical protein